MSTTTPRAATLTDAQIETVLDALAHLKAAQKKAFREAVILHKKPPANQPHIPLLTQDDFGIPQIDALTELFGNSERVLIEPMP